MKNSVKKAEKNVQNSKAEKNVQNSKAEKNVQTEKKSLTSVNLDNLTDLLKDVEFNEKIRKSTNSKKDIYNYESTEFNSLSSKFSKEIAEKRFRTKARNKLNNFVDIILINYKHNKIDNCKNEIIEFRKFAKEFYINFDGMKIENFRNSFKDDNEQKKYKAFEQILNLENLVC